MNRLPFLSPPPLTLGTSGPWFFPRPFSLTLKDLSVHSQVTGISGSGKSTFLTRLCLALFQAGQPFTLIDPHADLAKAVLSHLLTRGVYRNPAAFDRILYLDLPAAARRSLYLPFNPFVHTKENLSHETIAANFKEAMYRSFPELRTGAASFDALLPRAVRVLLHHNLDLTYLERFFLDDALRERLLSDFPEEHITTYFREAFANMRKGEQLAHGKAVLNRAALLLDLSLLRNSLGQPENLLQYRSLMDQGKTVIINLAVEQREAATLLGCLVTVAAEQAALSRSFSQNIAQRLSHHLIIDEFASFTEKDPTMFDSILSQTRKYGLFCVLSHQTYSQSGADVMQSLQNAQLKFIFKQDRADAEISARLLGAIDPMLVKHTVVDEAAVERTHPMFYSPVEQWESQIGQIQRLRPFEALVRLPSWQVRKARFPLLPLSPVTVRERQFVEEEYLRRYFRPPPTKTIPTASLASSPLSISAENPVFETASSRSRFGKRS